MAESGIPTFRSNRGYWQKYRFEDLATPEAFHRDPKFVWTWYEERRRAIVAGTSAQVYPEATGFSDGVAWSLRGTSAGILPQLVP